MSAELSIYRKMFVGLIESNDTSVIENNSPAHAKVILQELVRHAQMSVRILCTHFSRGVYGDPLLQEVIKDAISRGVDVRIAIRDEFPQTLDFYNQLQQIEGGPSSFFTLKRDGEEAFANDFCVVDGKRFRLERDQQKGTAFVCANDAELSQRLEAWFDKLRPSKVIVSPS